MANYEAVIGLEVHAQLMTQTKVFCSASYSASAEPNTCVSPVSAGLPGSLPVLNKKAVELAVRAGLALNCQIQKRSLFARKNYFYPDLPKSYQISQFELPICTGGYLDILPEGSKTSKRIHLERIHMEEDAGKSFHVANNTLVNLNRAGVPLIEIVTKPDLRSAAEAGAYLRKLHSILLHGEICDGNLEEGNFRCDVNVSIRRLGESALGTRTELKNLNSFRYVEKALDYEIARQIAIVDAGGKITQETRGWDSAASKTFSMRSKEDAQDYRYFPDPDLPPLILDASWIESIREQMPLLPDQKKKAFIERYSLSDNDAEEILSDRDWNAYFEKGISQGVSPKAFANWMLTDLLGELKHLGLEFSRNPISPERLASLVRLVESEKISGKIGKQLIREMVTDPRDPEAIVDSKGWLQVQDPVQLESWADQVISQFPEQVHEYRSGKTKVLPFLMGQYMKISQGRAHPEKSKEILLRKLS